MTPETVLYAIGDIHGRIDLLEKLIGRLRRHHARHFIDHPAKLVFVGDYVDRGPDSAGVVRRIRGGFSGFDTICLKGNHEAMMMNCLTTTNRDQWLLWISNGGDATLRSYGYNSREGRNPDALRACMGEKTLRWLQTLELFHREGDVAFVHAGVLPGIPLEEQDERDLLWIRNPFLLSELDYGFGVVHGHTPVETPEVLANRINIDTGAVYDGKLTALVVDRPWTELCRDPVFVQVD